MNNLNNAMPNLGPNINQPGFQADMGQEQNINRGKVKVNNSSDTERGEAVINYPSAPKPKNSLQAIGSNVLEEGQSQKQGLPVRNSLLKKKNDGEQPTNDSNA